MSMPFYVAPEQVMKDRAEYAQKGIARGRLAHRHHLRARGPDRGREPVALLCTRSARSTTASPSPAWASTTSTTSCGWPGVRHADTKGFAFSREDVDARSLANLYAQYLDNVFTHEMKPLEVEILVAELSADGGPDQLYHIAYEGTITDEEHFAVLGGDAETITERVEESWREGWTLEVALAAAVGALAGPDRTLEPGDLEVAVLSRQNGRRTFRRIGDDELAGLLGPGTGERRRRPRPAEPPAEPPGDAEA